MNAADTHLLEIRNLSAYYGETGRRIEEKTVLSGLSLNLAAHETVGLIGLNGAGKTTLIKILSGLLSTFRADSIHFDGQPVKLRDNAFKTCRYTVFAEDNSFQYFTFGEYLAYVFAAYGQKLPDVSELIQGFHFEEHADTLLKDLSTGNRKKAFLITAFALKPKLLFLDEPVNGLDFQSTEYLYRQISDYHSCGTLMFSSHILESITLTSDRVIVLENGRIRQTFEKEQINAADIREALRYENDV